MASESSGATDTNPHICTFCKKTFKTFGGLADHKSRSKNHFYCRRCRLDFSTAVELRQHLDSSIATVAFGPNGQVRCEPCKRCFSSMTILSTHLHSYHRNLCTDCLLDFHNPEALDKHRASAHFITNEPLIIPQSTNSDSVQSSSSNPSTSTSSAEADQQPPTTPSPEEITQENRPPPQESTEEKTVVEQQVDGIAPDAPRGPSPEEITQENRPPPQESTEEKTVVEQQVDEIAPEAPQGPSQVTVSWRPRYPHFCKICKIGFSSEEVLRQHLDHSSSVIPHARMPGGGFRCFVCLGMFPGLNGFKRHLSYLDRRHQYMLAKWCVPCLLQFHTHNALQKHIDAVHAPQSSQEQQQQPVANNESDSLSTQVAAMDLDATESPVAPAQTDSPLVPELRPLDRLFASISYPAAISPQETGAVDTSTSTSSQILPPQDDDQSPIDTVDTSDPTSTQLPTPPVLRPPENVEASPNPPSASSVVLSPPSPAPLPPRPDDFYCRKCKLSFANYQEQKDHVRNGMSAIKPAENNEGRLICVKCNRPCRDIHAMKVHLRSHDLTCIPCLLFFHVPWAHRAHMQSLHVANSSSGDDPSNEQPQFQAIITTHPSSEPRPATLVAEPTNRPSVPIPQEPRPAVRGHQPVSRNPRTVRQISLQDFSDTDEDDPPDMDNAQLGGWQESGPRGQRPDANAYSVRTGGNVLGRNQRRGGRGAPQEQRWWWGEGQPQPNSWDALASGGLREPPSIEVASSSKSGPKVPRVSSVAIACSVCLEEAAVDLTSTPCGHVGCETCLRKAVKTKPECPICRKPTRLTDLRPLFL